MFGCQRVNAVARQFANFFVLEENDDRHRGDVHLATRGRTFGDLVEDRIEVHTRRQSWKRLKADCGPWLPAA
jgi:hypothetical protein